MFQSALPSFGQALLKDREATRAAVNADESPEVASLSKQEKNQRVMSLLAEGWKALDAAGADPSHATGKGRTALAAAKEKLAKGVDADERPRHWRSVAKGRSPGPTGLNSAMIAALPPPESWGILPHAAAAAARK